MELSALDNGVPCAPRTGPFPFSAYLNVLWSHTAGDGDRLDVRSSDDGAVALWHHAGGVGFVGPENLVDYRSPIGGATTLLADALGELPAGTRFRFDSLPEEAADVVESALHDAGLVVARAQHEATAVLALPESMDDYMAAIGKKERHETRRKIRRFEEAHGAARLLTYDEPGSIMSWFYETHRRAFGEKGGFMTAEMEALFDDLIGLDGWQLDVVYGEGMDPVAAMFGYAGDDGYYLYNSAYDPDYRDASPGVVLLNRMIERAIGQGHQVFDFLKGDEVYKFRMGAEARPLYAFEGIT